MLPSHHSLLSCFSLGGRPYGEEQSPTPSGHDSKPSLVVDASCEMTGTKEEWEPMSGCAEVTYSEVTEVAGRVCGFCILALSYDMEDLEVVSAYLSHHELDSGL